MPLSKPEEKQAIIDYMNSQAHDLTVEFLQKVYVENVLGHQHAVWDVHTNVDRWWVITNPTNLYSQVQFPNMDLAVTFHVGLCIRVPRSEKPKFSDLQAVSASRTSRLMAPLRLASSPRAVSMAATTDPSGAPAARQGLRCAGTIIIMALPEGQYPDTTICSFLIDDKNICAPRL